MKNMVAKIKNSNYVAWSDFVNNIYICISGGLPLITQAVDRKIASDSWNRWPEQEVNFHSLVLRIQSL